MRKILTLISKILANVLVIVFGLTLVASDILLKNADSINSFFGVQTTDTIEIEADENGDYEYYKSDFNSVRETKDNAEKLTQQVVGEGAVLLKNNGALPLEEGKRSVSLFSISSVNYVTAGTGSSGTNNNKPITLKEAMEASGFTVNSGLWSWYSNNTSRYGRGSAGGGIGVTFRIQEAPWSVLPTAKSERADAAIFVLSRNGGEGADLTVRGGNASDMTNGNYLALSPQEADVLSNLKALKDAGTFTSIIVLMNSANQVECDFIDDERFGIDAALWIGDTGSTGIKAVAKILSGEINPSGRLTDTFWKKHYLNPVYANFDAYTFVNGKAGNYLDTYVVYQEGIYNGYRYTETRYEDVVLGVSTAGYFDYQETVAYPFGYGLSYTDFAYSDVSITPPLRGARNYTVSVTVTNTGNVAGKDVVEIYLQKPYTAYDVDHGIEKAAVELVGFAKTKLLEPKATERVTVEVDEREFVSYDADGAGTYILDAGDYYLTVARDAHEAINNILSAKGMDVGDGMTDAGNPDMAKKFTKTFDAKTYSVSDATGAKIVNRFDDADLNRYEGAESKVVYLSRNDWEGTCKLGLSSEQKSLENQVPVTLTQKMKEDAAIPVPEKDDIEYPTYGSEKTHYSLVDLRVDEEGNTVPYDSPLWDDLLDQMTWKETVDLLTHGLRMTYAVQSINKPQTIDHNGATGPVQPYGDNANINNGLAVKNNDPDKNEYPTLYPCNGLVAATFNEELIEEMGEAMGNDCLWAGYNGIYGFGVNLHRGAYGGRAFEYYSEDGFLTGVMAAAEVRGIQSKGTQVYMKHCVLNDQEDNREGLCVFANEQTIRELYLRAFEIPIERANAYNVMTGFNRLGMKWTGHHGFLNTVLHEEFGMLGMAVTDWYTGGSGGYMSLPAGVLAGSDLPDGTATSEFNGYEEGYGAVAWAMRESAHRILYMHAHGNAMNGLSSNTSIILLTPVWITALKGARIALGVLAGASVLFLAGMLVWNFLEEKKKKED